MVFSIAVVGCGAVGLNYGLRLLETEIARFTNGATPTSNTYLVLRSDYTIVKEHGMILHCNENDPIVFQAEDIAGNIFPSIKALSQEKGTMDLIIIAVKGYSLTDDFIDSLAEISDENTKFLVIVNGLGLEEMLANKFQRKNIVGGISLIGCNRLYASPPSAGPITVRNFKDHRLDIGHIDDNMLVVQGVYQLWQRTRIADLVKIVPSLLAARWSKLCWNITFSGIAVAMGGVTVDIIERDDSLHALAESVMKEIMMVAKMDLLYQHYLNLVQKGGIEEQIIPMNNEVMQQIECTFVNNLPETDVHIARMWSSTVNLGPYKSSTVVDLINDNNMEIENIFSIPLQKAKFLSAVFPELSYGHLESVILMVEGIARIQQSRRHHGKPWNATAVEL